MAQEVEELVIVLTCPKLTVDSLVRLFGHFFSPPFCYSLTQYTTRRYTCQVMTETVSVRIPKDLYLEIKALAKAEYRPLQSQLVLLLRAALKARTAIPPGA